MQLLIICKKLLPDVIRNGNETVSHLHYVHLACTLRSNIDKSDVKMLFRSLKSKYCDQISTDAGKIINRSHCSQTKIIYLIIKCQNDRAIN